MKESNKISSPYSLHYRDILLVPKYSELESRKIGNTEMDLCGRKVKLPVMPANMKSVINVELSNQLSESGYFYIMHRFDLDTAQFVRDAQTWKLISISTGVNEDSLKGLKQIKSEGLKVDFITIDVAHCHHIKGRKRIEWLKENMPQTKVIAGNVATKEAVKDLICWGANAVKIGCGQGRICTTRFQTGFSVPMFSCIKECSEENPKKRLIADGGVACYDEETEI